MAEGFRGLVDGACGNANPLMKLTTHFTEDKAKADFLKNNLLQKEFQLQDASNGLAEEFLRTGQNFKISSFNMKDLIQNVPKKQPQQHFARPDFESVWKLETESNQSVGNLPFHLMGPAPSLYQSQSQDINWASEYLDKFEQKSNSSQKLLDVLEQDGKFSKSDLKSYLKNYSTHNNWTEEFLQSNRKVSWEDEFHDTTENDFESYYQESKEKTTSGKSNINSDFWHSLESQWKEAGLIDDQEESWVNDYEKSHIQNNIMKDYNFQSNNPLENVKDCLKEGKIKLSEGDLPSAVLLFEAAAKQHPENPEVWLLLGKSQAKNEQDVLAIAALVKSLQLDSTSLDAIQSIAASFANESLHSNACQALQDWIHSNPKYYKSSPIGLSCINKQLEFEFMTREQHQATMDLYLNAARQNHQNGEIDADIQNGLGILFNLSSEFEKAAECFKAALSIRPDDVLLWNRLGATLANGNQSEEAISAYHEALRLDPGFVRSRYNLGVSCINLRAYQEAADHFMAALNFQAAGRGVGGEDSLNPGPMSSTIWKTLRLSLSLMGRSDLNIFIEERNLLELNKRLKVKDIK